MSFGRCESGAVMVMATFFALFLVGLVYHVAGVGHGALEQQIMQDAADSVAFSAATAKARGMNVIALINLVMAVVLAVLVGVRVLLAILAVATAIVGVACIVSQGAACGAITLLAAATAEVKEVDESVEPVVKEILTVLEAASDAVAQVTPILAEAEAVYISTRDIYDPAEIGFVFPIADELPVKEGSFEDLCGHAAEDVVDICAALLPPLLPEVAIDAVGELVSAVAKAFSSYFCGGDDSSLPKAMNQEKAYPLAEHHECDSAESRPNSDDGSCDTSSCESCAALGCAKCLTEQEKDAYRRGQWTRRTEVKIVLVGADGGEDVLETREPVQELLWFEEDPCSGEGSCGGDEICSREERFGAGDDYPAGAEQVVRTAFTHLHGCLIEEEIEMEVSGEPLDEDDWPKPKALDEEEVPEGLRLRGFVLGGTARKSRLRRVGIAGGEPGFGLGQRISFAAADFLSPDMDLWHMNWRSRLIRFRMEGTGLASSCSGSFAAECGQVGEKVDGFSGGGGFGSSGLGDFLAH